MLFYFFFQAEDGIRDTSVTGVQTCALPIFGARFALLFLCLLAAQRLARGRFHGLRPGVPVPGFGQVRVPTIQRAEKLRELEIGRASCRERVSQWGGGVCVKTERGVRWWTAR